MLFTAGLLLPLLPLCIAHAGHHDEDGGKRNIHVKNPVLLISLDGFRWDYIQRLERLTREKNVTNHFGHMIENGIWAEKGISNAYSTVTFPNHYTLVTGLYEESHNIIGNSIYDPVTDRTYNLMTEKNESAFLYGGEPLWHTFAREKGEDDVAVYMWPGSDVTIRGHPPVRNHVVYRSLYNCHPPFTKSMEWLRQGMKLSIVYYHDPDSKGHSFGPDSEEVNAELLAINDCLGDLLRATKTMEPRPNIILTSDHGMTKFIKHVEMKSRPELYRITNSHYSHLIVEPVPGKEAEAIAALKADGGESVRIFPVPKIPEYLHYKRNRLIRGLLVMGALGVSLDAHGKGSMVAGHGYDTRESNMRPFLVGMGPGLRRGARAPARFHSVDVYLLVCSLLGLVAAPNNGTVALVRAMLSEEGRLHSPNEAAAAAVERSTAIAAGVSVGVVAWVLIVLVLFRAARKRRPTLVATNGALRLDRGFVYQPVASKAQHSQLTTDEEEDEEFVSS